MILAGDCSSPITSQQMPKHLQPGPGPGPSGQLSTFRQWGGISLSIQGVIGHQAMRPAHIHDLPEMGKVTGIQLIPVYMI